MGKRYIPDIAAIQRMWRCKREIGKRNGSVTTAIFAFGKKCNNRMRSKNLQLEVKWLKSNKR